MGYSKTLVVVLTLVACAHACPAPVVRLVVWAGTGTYYWFWPVAPNSSTPWGPDDYDSNTPDDVPNLIPSIYPTSATMPPVFDNLLPFSELTPEYPVFNHITGMEYELNYFSRNFYEAIWACKRNASELAMIRNRYDYMYIKTLVDRIDMKRVSDQYEWDHTFVWIADANRIAANLWKINRSDYFNGSGGKSEPQLCVGFRPNFPYIRKSECHVRHPFVCERIRAERRRKRKA